MSADKQTHRTNRKPFSNFKRLSQRFMSGLLRSLFLLHQPSRTSRAGFVLPTTVLLLLMVTLTVGAMSYRTFSRTTQTIAYRDQQVVDSLAAPAVDRAKAKIEYLFTQDSSVADKRPPSSEDLILAMAAHTDDTDDPYTITGPVADGGETRIDIDGDSSKDPAWSFQAPDGTQIIYSIILDDTNNGVSLDSDVNDETKADNFVTRNGPIDTTSPNGKCPVARLAGNGWQLSGARLAKNIQVNVLAVKGDGPNKTVSASEYQQVRTASRGNRWGAWFRYDMEVAPGAPLRWNGAIHTEGSLITNKKFLAFMVSSTESCVYDDDASVIEVSGAIDDNDDGTDDFLGQLVSGTITRTGNASFVDETGLFHTDKTAKASPNYSDGIEKLNADDNKTPKDSVTPKNSGSAGDILQDPIAIFTRDGFVHTDDSNGEDKWDRYTDWENTGGISRVINDESNASRPFLDDGYRADSRYGPKFAYNKDNTFFKVRGTELADADKHKSGDKITDNDLLTQNIPDTENYGLDGYWERSAAAQGLRVVVGQRLELGNTFRWKGNDDPLYPPNDAFTEMKAKDGTVLKKTAETLQMRSLRDNLAAVQSMAVYHADDSSTNGQYPLACIASVVHPGTADTLKNSRTFNKYSYSSAGGTVTGWETDFLTGNGTNGIEFAPPPAGDFDNSTGIIASKWVNALKNLAYFAGDPKGGAPSFPAVQDKEGADGFVHPYPYMSMWGDFSILRRLFTDSTFNYSPATKYNELSIADKSTIQTAACTLGMLAHNVSLREQEADAILENSSIHWTNLGNKVTNIVKGNVSNGSPIIGRPLPTDPNYKSPGLCKGTQALKPTYSDPDWTGCPSQNPNDVTDPSDSEYITNYLANFSTEEWLAVLQGVNNNPLNTAEANEIRILAENSQILRDRTLGFKEGGATGDLSGNYDPISKLWTNPPSSGPDNVGAGGTNAIAPGDAFPTSCDPRVFAETSVGNPTQISNSSKARFGLALVVCSTDVKPKYPALYYIFPKFNHGQKGADDSGTSGINHTQPSSENYIDQPYISGVNGSSNNLYTAVDVADIALTPNAPNESAWRTPAKLVATSSSDDFSFSGGPTSASAAAYNASAIDDPGNLEKNLSQNIIAVKDGSNYKYYQTSFLDKAIMDGRELLSVRLMDADINLLTNVDAASSSSGGTAADLTVGGKAWIPEETGIFYAFREDAVREDSIARPFAKAHTDADAAWSTCSNMDSLTTDADCYMFLDPSPSNDLTTLLVDESTFEPHDPPLNSGTGISPKPVDLFADPDRRPHGFRLINGKSLNRTATDSNDASAGMTFVTDNAAYIKGDFNLHAVKGASNLEANLIEEFVGSGNLLGTDFATYGDSDTDNKNARKLFYGRTNLDSRFADPSKDNWRPVEIFADGTTMLSDIFLDGWIEDYFVTASPEATNDDRGKPTKNSSFLNAHRPWFRPDDQEEYNSDRWLHESTDSTLTPVFVDRNGKTLRKIDDGSGDPVEFPKASDGKNINFYKKSHIGSLLFRTMQTQQPSPYADDPVRINALLVGGIVPARDEQSNGGLYNFPRLLEFWPGKPLVISGGFFQLNFSSQSTGPWDQDAWEPGSPSHSDSNRFKEIGSTGNQITSTFYYGAATRVWGYDVAFQYTPAGPIARRFVRLDRPRSEFYRELPVDDPYIQMLCSQAGGSC